LQTGRDQYVVAGTGPSNVVFRANSTDIAKEKNRMPMVQITMLEGRTAEQKRKIAQRITDALVEEAATKREGVMIAFHEVSKESYSSGGVLMVDKN